MIAPDKLWPTPKLDQTQRRAPGVLAANDGGALITSTRPVTSPQSAAITRFDATLLLDEPSEPSAERAARLSGRPMNLELSLPVRVRATALVNGLTVEHTGPQLPEFDRQITTIGWLARVIPAPGATLALTGFGAMALRRRRA